MNIIYKNYLEYTFVPNEICRYGLFINYRKIYVKLPQIIN